MSFDEMKFKSAVCYDNVNGQFTEPPTTINSYWKMGTAHLLNLCTNLSRKLTENILRKFPNIYECPKASYVSTWSFIRMTEINKYVQLLPKRLPPGYQSYDFKRKRDKMLKKLVS